MKSVGIIFFAVLLTISSAATERIHIVGSSTVFPLLSDEREEMRKIAREFPPLESLE